MICKYKNMDWEKQGDEYVLMDCASGISAVIERDDVNKSLYWVTLRVGGFRFEGTYTKLSSAIRGSYRAFKRLYDITHRE